MKQNTIIAGLAGALVVAVGAVGYLAGKDSGHAEAAPVAVASTPVASDVAVASQPALVVPDPAPVAAPVKRNANTTTDFFGNQPIPQGLTAQERQDYTETCIGEVGSLTQYTLAGCANYWVQVKDESQAVQALCKTDYWNKIGFIRSECQAMAPAKPAYSEANLRVILARENITFKNEADKTYYVNNCYSVTKERSWDNLQACLAIKAPDVPDIDVYCQLTNYSAIDFSKEHCENRKWMLDNDIVGD